MLTRRAFEVLRIMVECAEIDEEFEPEITVDGGTVWLGCERIRRSTLDQLLRVAAIKQTVSGHGCERWVANDTGAAILRRPELADEVFIALHGCEPFTIRDDHVVLIQEPAHG